MSTDSPPGEAEESCTSTRLASLKNPLYGCWVGVRGGAIICPHPSRLMRLIRTKAQSAVSSLFEKRLLHKIVLAGLESGSQTSTPGV